MKRILTIAVMLVAGIAAFAAEPLSEMDILVGQEQRLLPAGPLLTGIAVEEGEDFLEVHRAGYMLTMKGLRAGDTKIRLDLRDGQTSTLLVHVKSVRIRPVVKPGETEPEKPVWTGTYELRLPENHYSIIFHSFDAGGRERVQESYSCIDSVFVVGESQESEDGFDGMEHIIDVFDFSSKLGYNGGLMPDGRYRMFYGDGNAINPDNERDGHDWFDMYAPASLAVALIGIDPADFGRDNHGDDDLENGTIMQRIRMTGGDQSHLKRYYKGEDVICGRTCWVFDFRGTNLFGYGGYCVWVDQETGLVLRHDAEDGGGFIVTRFDLNYTAWDIEIRPDLFE
jgi:Negative regulator of sigma E activity